MTNPKDAAPPASVWIARQESHEGVIVGYALILDESKLSLYHPDTVTALVPRADMDAEITRLQDGIRDHLISLGAPDSMIDGAGCDSGDSLDFTKAEITQAFNYFTDDTDDTDDMDDMEAKVAVIETLRELAASLETCYRLSIERERALESQLAAANERIAASEELFRLTVSEKDAEVARVRAEGIEAAIEIADVCTCGSGPEFRSENMRYHAVTCSKHIATMIRATLLESAAKRSKGGES